jgi:5'-nucleotidase
MWMQTYSKGAFHYRDQKNRKSSINIEDIAVSLARQPRFLGHSQRFISIAEHSIAVGHMTKLLGGDPLDGLLHDAHEAYTGDIIRPFALYLDRWKNFNVNPVKNYIQKRVYLALELECPCAASNGAISLADGYALRYERENFCNSALDWGLLGEIPDHLYQEFDQLYRRQHQSFELDTAEFLAAYHQFLEERNAQG